VGTEVRGLEPSSSLAAKPERITRGARIYSGMSLSDRIKEMTIAPRRRARKIAAVARGGGMLTLRRTAVSRVRAGLTKPEEVLRCHC